MLVEVEDLKWADYECNLQLNNFAQPPHSIRMDLVEKGTGMPIATASKYLQDFPLSTQQALDKVTWIKDYAENESLFQALVEANIVEDLDTAVDINGFGCYMRLAKILV